MRFTAVAGVALAGGLIGGVASWYLLKGGPKREAYIDLFVYQVTDPKTKAIVCKVATVPFHAYVREKSDVTWQVRPDSGPCAADVKDFDIMFNQRDDIYPEKPGPTGNPIPSHQKTTKLKKLFSSGNPKENTRKYTVLVTLNDETKLVEDPEVDIWR